MSTYVTKCIGTQTKTKVPSHGMLRTVSVKTNLESACGGAGPQLCADGYEQIGDLYAEAAGAYTSHLTK